jgi:putative tryptophan/tyrosine transport system substrate-binding protein
VRHPLPGYIDGQNVHVEYRWAYGTYDRLPGMADELVKLPADVLFAIGTPAARVAKSASLKVHPAVPVVFNCGADPVAEGLVATLNRPGGNVTGSTSIGGSLAPKRLELLAAIAPDAAAVALLINPDNSVGETERNDSEAASRIVGRRLEIFTARNELEIVAGGPGPWRNGRGSDHRQAAARADRDRPCIAGSRPRRLGRSADSSTPR